VRNLLLGLSIGIGSLLVGGTAVAVVGIAVIAPLVAALLALHRRAPPPSRPIPFIPAGDARFRIRSTIRPRDDGT
jgi:hypothetical protein